MGACWILDLITCSKLSHLSHIWWQKMCLNYVCLLSSHQSTHSLSEELSLIFLLSLSHFIPSLAPFLLFCLLCHFLLPFLSLLWPSLLSVPVSFSRFTPMSFLSMNLEPAHRGENITCRYSPLSMYCWHKHTPGHAPHTPTELLLPQSSVTVFALIGLMVLFDLNSCD